MDALQYIPLRLLTYTKRNVRKVKSEETADDELQASIAAHGVKQNLVVTPRPNGKDGFHVVAGGRRLKALYALVKSETPVQGEVIDEDYQVPCQLLGDEEDAGEVSLAENIIREPLHPADQYEQFAKLFKKGKGLSVEQIAERFGVSEHTVDQRLRLGMLHPVLLKNYRDGNCNLETLMAFTLAGEDHDRQMEAAKAVSKANNGRVDGYSVKEYLTQDKMYANNSLVKFVGLEAYEEAGGEVTRDLFAQEDTAGIYIEQPDLIHQLANAKLEEEVEKRDKQGWKWVGICLDGFYEEVRRHDEFEPAAGKGRFTKTEMAFCGCLISVDYSGKVQVERGLVKREDRVEARKYVAQKRKEAEQKAAEAQEAQAAAAEAGEDTGNGEAPPAPEVEVPDYSHSPTGSGGVDVVKQAIKDAGLTMALTDDLQVWRSNITRWTLLRMQGTAIDALTYSLARQLFCVYHEDTPLDVTCRAARTDPPGADHPKDPGQELFDNEVEQFKQRHCRWLLGLDEIDGKVMIDRAQIPAKQRWETFCALSEEEKLAVGAMCAAMMFRNQTGICYRGNEEIEAITAELQPKFSLFRPTADNFFKRLSKPELIKILEKVADDKNPERVKLMRGYKKGELAETLGKMFDNPDDEVMNLDDVTKRRIREWYPPSFNPKKLVEDGNVR